jgi:tetratricopeptide (TPR) repeat protein
VSLYQEGRAEQLEENYYRAVELYKQALELNPAYLAPLVGLAESFLLLAQYDEAISAVGDARRQDRNNLSLVNLEAKIRMGLGEVAEARRLFESVLRTEPYNLDARFGLAQLDIADGKRRKAASQYLEALKASPDNIHALLSLAVLYEELGDDEASQAYLDQALKTYTDDPQVYFAAGGYYYRRGSHTTAWNYLETALALEPEYDEARQLLGNILLHQGKPTEAIALYKEFLSTSREETARAARYTLGLAYAGAGMWEQALASYNAVLREASDDEVVRITAENLTLEHPEETARWRKSFSRYHAFEAAGLQERDQLGKALLEFRRSLRLDPDDPETRLAYASIYRILGYPVKYLMELLLLKSYYGYGPVRVEDEIEVYESRLGGGVANRWFDRLRPDETRQPVFDQYTVEPSAHSLLLFTIPSRNSLIHILSDSELAAYLEDLLQRFSSLNLTAHGGAAESFDLAFEAAREAATDFFLVCSFDEEQRSFLAVCEIYLTRTGALLERHDAFRTGNNRVRDAMAKLADLIKGSFPARATLLARDFSSGVINLGRFQGIEEGHRFLIVKKGELGLSTDVIDFLYRDEDVLGEFVVTDVDENLSEGTIVPAGFFDRINPGDELVELPP